MANVTFKCPSCGAYLVFDPDSQKWTCPFCNSVYLEDELLAKSEQYAAEAEQEKPETVPTESGEQVIYNCPSCGSQIMTDETTVATQCYYCHNPVVLQGKLTNDMKPDSVLPFSISKEKAVETFLTWVKKKRFVPKGYFNEAEIKTMQGVYYPHFVSDLTVEGEYDGEGRNTSIVDTPKYVITNTDHYHFHREGTIKLRSIMRPALSSVNRKLSDGIHPFPLDDVKPFSGAYLSGFLAERRDIDADSIREDVVNEAQGYVEPLFDDTLHYDSHNGTSSASLKDIKTKYVLLPTWVLTYPNKEKPDDPYYYAMNGRTGEVCGKLPISGKRLCFTSLLVGLAAFALGLVLCYFIL